MDILAGPLGIVIREIYNFINNYGLAIIVFTLLVKILTVPLGINQQKTASKTKLIQPELNALKKQYKNDKEKLNQETMKLYQKNNISPLSGCLPLLIQLPILMGLYGAIQNPITHILNVDVAKLIEGVTVIGADGAQIALDKISQLQLLQYQEILNKLAEMGKSINFDFLWINLTKTPSINEPSLLWLIPILATGATFLSSFLTKKLTGSPSSDDQAAGMAKSMTFMMPVLTLFITFTTPTAIGLYWFVSTIFGVVQQVIMTRIYDKKFGVDKN